MMTRCVYLSMGSNVGDRRVNLREALRRLSPEVDVISVSSLYETDPVGVTEQPKFLNVAVAGRTNLDARALLSHVKSVERGVGRVPTYRWGPRVVDIDIVAIDGVEMDEPDLQIPHARMAERAFVLVPLAEIARGVVHRGMGKTVGQLVEDVEGREGVRPLGQL